MQRKYQIFCAVLAIVLLLSCKKDNITNSEKEKILPIVMTDTISNVSYDKVILIGKINPGTTDILYHFEYGTTMSYGNKSVQHSLNAGSGLVTVMDTVYNLHSSTLYHYRIVCNAGIDTIKGADRTFTTLNDPLPTIVTNPPTNITTHSAIFNGTINPHGISSSYYFEYGTTTSYGSQSPQKNINTGPTQITVSDTILNLQPATLYHHRIVCSNSAGTSRGDDRSFTTADLDYFPKTPGCKWIYSFYDAVHLRSDTVTVTITSTGTWVYTASSGTTVYPAYTEGVSVSPNMVQMNSNSSESRIYMLPFVAGNTWNGPPPQYTFVNYWVSRQDSITTPAGKFYGAFLVRMAAFNGGNTTYIDDRVFVPKIGFVKRNESITGAAIGTVSAYNWVLISFKIVE